MKFPVMHRRMRNARAGTRSTARSASSSYTPPVSPVADAGNNQTVLVGETVSFDGSGSSGTNLTYSWAFGSGATPASGSGDKPTCTYSTPGTKVVGLTVTDDAGVEASDTVTINVHSAPVAEAGSDQTVLVGDTVNFDGSGSYDPDGGNLTYSWDFGSGAMPTTGSGVTPSCSYSTRGTKTVTLTVTDNNGATDSDTVTITVDLVPPCSDAGSDQTVLVGETVNFDGSGSCDPDGGNLSYSWDFGSGATPATGSVATPSCTYSTIGTKRVTLTVTDDNGATASDTVTITVHNAPIAEAGDNQDVSVDATVSFDGSGSSDPDGGNLTYSWAFGTDATPATSSAEMPSCTYSTTGAKTVTLTVTDDEGVSRSDTATITVHSLPDAEAGDDQDVSVNDTVNFDGSGSTGSNLTYSWDFGSGATPASGSGVTPSCTYSTAGTKVVRLTVTDVAGATASDMVTITVTSPPVPPDAEAGANQTVSVNDTVDFDGSGSTGNNLTYSWDFDTDVMPSTATPANGSGVTSSCSYSTTGAKTVTLTVTDTVTELTDSDTVTINVKPIADAGDNQTVLVNGTVSFDGSGSTGNNLTYSWDFGADATPATGTGATPSCTYSTIGTKTVTLTVTDTATGLTDSDTVTITVHKAPIAEAGNNQTVLVGETVLFNGLGSSDPDGGDLTYSWAFGTDATPTTGTGATPYCSYSTRGTKTVTLTVTDDEGATASDTVTITVHGAPIAEAGSDQTVLVGETVNFDGSGSSDPDGGNLTYSWLFGTDATPATGSGVAPSCSYSTTGTKTVTLIVTDVEGVSRSDTVTITVHSGPCSTPGNDQTVSVGEIVNFDGSGSCDPDGGELIYSWDFGTDATPATGTGATPSCTYSTIGTKIVTLTVTDDEGATASDTVTITVIDPPDTLVVNAGDDQTVVVGETVNFAGSVSNAPEGVTLSYSWAFGPDATPTIGSTLASSCTYSTTGAKTVTLTGSYTADGKTVVASDTVTITVHNAPICRAGDDQRVAVGSEVSFDGSRSYDPEGGELTYSWAFGTDADPATSSADKPFCIYSTRGAKTVTLTVTDVEGATASDTVTITVYNPPVANAGDDQTVALGSEVSFDGSGSRDPDGGNLTYLWEFGADADPATGNAERPLCTYSTTGTKVVKLTVTDDEGATASDTVTITVTSASPTTPVANAGDDQLVILGSEVSFDGSGSTGNNLSYSWDFGAGADPPTAEGVRPFCLYSTPGERTVTLSVTDDNDMVTLDTVTITVLSMKPQTANDGESVDFEVLGAEGATGFTWGWELPSELGSNPDVGNSPAVVFPPTGSRKTTIENAKWYAYPNRECPDWRDAAASKSSVYTITCNVTFDEGRALTVRSTLTVNVPWVFAGFIEIGFIGSPTIEQDSETQLWKVTDLGSIKRSLNSKNSVPMSSQFYDKVRRHEEVHVKNLNTGLARTYYTVNGLWANHLSGLTAENRADLEILVQWAVEDFIDTENDRIRSLLPRLERAAYNASDVISPRYLYQRCNRFH